MEKKLNEFVPREKGRVKTVVAEGKIRRRLFDMGVTPGAEIVMIKTAPLGDPIEINVRGYELSLRKSEAETVILEIVG
jgi:Fe2+ transport system protein FeoA